MPATARDLQELNDVVGKIYDVVLKPQDWPALLQHITRYMRAERGLLQTPTLSAAQGRLAFSYGIPESVLRSYADHFIAQDPWIPAILERAAGRDGVVVITDDVVPTRQLLRSAFYTEFLRQTDVVHNCGG